MNSGITVEKAKLYECYRLPYAKEMVEDLRGCIGNPGVVADIGAGTGQLARMFADGSIKVYAVEPDSAMRKVASESLKNSLNIKVVAGYAEQTTLAANSIDLIVVGNAFHRFKPGSCAEFRRILKKQGWVALVSYRFLNIDFTDMLFSRLAELKGFTYRVENTWHTIPIQKLFGDGQIHTLRYRQSQMEDWTVFFGAARAGLEAPDGADPEFVQFEAINRGVFEAFAIDGRIQVDYETQVSFEPLM